MIQKNNISNISFEKANLILFQSFASMERSIKSLRKFETGVFVSLLIVISGSAFLAVLPVDAHTPPWTIPTYVYLNAAPNPVSLGQQTNLQYWFSVQPATSTSNTGYRWQNITIDIIKPDGYIDHFGNLTSDPSGQGYLSYTPNQIGIYIATLTFPQQVLTRINPFNGLVGPDSVYVNDTYTASSANATFIVQQETSTQSFQDSPLPVSYWERPIDANRYTWYSISSSWLGQNEFGATYLRYQPQGWGPNTAHVLNTIPLAWGGVVGGDNSLNAGGTFYEGLHRVKFANPLILYGTLYFSLPQGNAAAGEGVTAIDLRTGQTKWTNPAIKSLSFGQLLDYESPNERGTSGYLWYTGTAVGNGIVNPGTEAVNALSNNYAPGTPSLSSFASVTNTTLPVNNADSWIAVDPVTGHLLFNLTNVPNTITVGGQPIVNTPVRAYGPQGEWLLYSIGRQNTTTSYTYLWQWNNTKLPGFDVPQRVPAWEPGTSNWNMSTAYDWNVTLSQALYSTTNQFGSYNPTIVSIFPGNLIFGQSSGLQVTTSSSSGNGTPDPYTLWTINLNASRGPIGQVLWQKNYPAPSGNKTVIIGPSDGETNVFTLYYKETMQWVGYDLLTGNNLWGPTASESALNYFSGVGGSIIAPNAIGYGRLYSTGYSGTLYSYDLKTGKLIFTYGNDPNNPSNSTITSDTGFGVYPLQIGVVADNKVYLTTAEHTLSSPPYQGAKTRAIDALTGKELWATYGMSSWRTQAVADGYYVWLNLNDMQIYITGPGPSATSVTAPDIGVPIGTPLLIKGTITDQSPKLKDTPAISDADQGSWMDYIVQHNTDQPNVTGVPIQLTILAQDGTLAKQVTVTSDSSGLFHFPWTAQAAGEYTIIANFTGTQSYGPSSAKTSVVIAEVKTPITSPPLGEPVTYWSSNQYVIIGSIAVLAIIIAVIAALVVLKKSRRTQN